MPRTKPANIAVYRLPHVGEHPDVVDWLLSVSAEASADDRVESVSFGRVMGHPIALLRNTAAADALAKGFDALVFVDNDMSPDPGWWKAAFDFWWSHEGPCVVGAPYCTGPGPECKVTAFVWRNHDNWSQGDRVFLRSYGREEAAEMTGIKQVSAVATGLCLIDCRVFSLAEEPWFYEEYEDAGCRKRASTEDVPFMRDASLAGVPIYCTWDHWAGHWKSVKVEKPEPTPVAVIPRKFRHRVVREYEKVAPDDTE